jgi:ABC-type branched-subunit amino acid transport system substrate-binding protein
VGFLVSDFSKTAAAFGVTGPPQDPQAGFKGLVTHANRGGGFGGRQIKPVYFTLDASEPNWDVADQAACSTFTEDNHVEVVVSQNWIRETLNGCLLKAGVPLVDGSQSPNNDRKGLAKYPNVFAPNAVETDRRAAALVDYAVKAGWLGRQDTLGVAADGCPWNTRTADEVMPQKARQHGFQLDVVVATDCGVGFQDAGKFTAGMGNAAFRLRANGANKILFLVQGENGGLAFFSTSAESQGWHPSYLVSSSAFPSDTQSQGQIPAGQLPNIRGLGWVPPTDVANPQPTGASRQCVATSVEGGAPEPSTPYQSLNRYSACTAFWVAAAVFDKTQGRAGIATFRAAAEGLGSAVVSALTVAGAMRLDADHHAGASMGNGLQFNQACSCFQYVGSPQPLP